MISLRRAPPCSQLWMTFKRPLRLLRWLWIILCKISGLGCQPWRPVTVGCLPLHRRPPPQGIPLCLISPRSAYPPRPWTLTPTLGLHGLACTIVFPRPVPPSMLANRAPASARRPSPGRFNPAAPQCVTRRILPRGPPVLPNLHPAPFGPIPPRRTLMVSWGGLQPLHKIGTRRRRHGPLGPAGSISRVWHALPITVAMMVPPHSLRPLFKSVDLHASSLC
jgi:hypothetical protein